MIRRARQHGEGVDAQEELCCHTEMKVPKNSSWRHPHHHVDEPISLLLSQLLATSPGMADGPGAETDVALPCLSAGSICRDTVWKTATDE